MNCEYEMVLYFNKSLSCIMAMACADAKATLIAEECISACKHHIANITKINLSYFFYQITCNPSMPTGLQMTWNYKSNCIDKEKQGTYIITMADSNTCIFIYLREYNRLEYMLLAHLVPGSLTTKYIYGWFGAGLPPPRPGFGASTPGNWFPLLPMGVVYGLKGNCL